MGVSSPAEACGAKFELRRCFIHLSQEDELRSGGVLQATALCRRNFVVGSGRAWTMFRTFWTSSTALYWHPLWVLFGQLGSVDIEAWVSA